MQRLAVKVDKHLHNDVGCGECMLWIVQSNVNSLFNANLIAVGEFKAFKKQSRYSNGIYPFILKQINKLVKWDST